MLKVTIERKGIKPVFEVGSLVQLDPTQFDDGGYVVLVTKVVNNSHTFGGVVVQCDEPRKDDTSIFVGDHSNNFTRHSFVKFVGKLTMEQV